MRSVPAIWCPCHHGRRLREVATEKPLTPFDDGTLRIDFVHQKITIDRKPVSLKPAEHRLLAPLALRRGEIFTLEKLTELFASDSRVAPRGSGACLDVSPDKAGPEGGRRADSDGARFRPRLPRPNLGAKLNERFRQLFFDLWETLESVCVSSPNVPRDAPSPGVWRHQGFI